MPDLITAATTETLIKVTGGRIVKHGGSSTWGHFERVPVGVLDDAPGEGVLTAEPSVVIPTGRLPAFGPKEGIGERVVVVEADSSFAEIVATAAPWRVRDVVPGDEDGALLRLMLAEV